VTEICNSEFGKDDRREGRISSGLQKDGNTSVESLKCGNITEL